jgi:hypothetical protein
VYSGKSGEALTVPLRVLFKGIKSYQVNEKLTPSLLWDNVKELIEREENAYLIFDHTVMDKRYSEELELTRWQ